MKLLLLLVPCLGACTLDASAHRPEELPRAESSWTIIEPGGKTRCAHGEPFRFFVRPGTVNRVVVEFEGGGACWNAATCARGSGYYTETADPPPFVTGAGPAEGLRDHDDPRNPVKDWHHILIPYCTGDIHWGQNTMRYGPDEIVYHYGAINASAVFAWLYQHFVAPERLLVAGCSAGGYGALLGAAYLKRHYPHTAIAQLGDSAVGIITETYFTEIEPAWQAQRSYPDWIPGIDPERLDSLSTLYRAIGSYYPDLRLSQYTTIADANQVFFYQAMGGGPALEWTLRMLAALVGLEWTTPNFRAYVASGSEHCILPFERFYTVTVDGVAFVDWLGALTRGEPLGSVYCRNCLPPWAGPWAGEQAEMREER